MPARRGAFRSMRGRLCHGESGSCAGLVFSIMGSCVGVALVYQHWTDPAVVREMVIAKLQNMYPGAVVTVDSARLRILGGIQVNELRMRRRDDPDGTDFFHVPSAIIYHDKEKISQGLLTLRKIELHHPRLRDHKTAERHLERARHCP